MAYWLIKSEPDVWSFEQQTKKGAKGEAWTGVRNFTARRHLQEMKKGDRAFFYHSVDEKQIVGIVEVIAEYKPDPTDETGKFGLVDVKAVKDFPKPVTLAQVKADPKLKDIVLAREPRLSVQPVTPAEWKHICKLGGVKD
jgi:predicted RNA-binding protein with PUA-like domain